jgi:phosphatidate cytidylyltransferase
MIRFKLVSYSFVLRVISCFFLTSIFLISICNKYAMSGVLTLIFSISFYELFMLIDLKNNIIKFLGITLISLSYISLIFNVLEEDVRLVRFIFMTSSFHDVGGYIFGNLFGSIKLAPGISPKKTLEGFMGSVLFVYFGNIIFERSFIIFDRGINGFIFAIVSSIFYALICLLGDLFFSKIKRISRIKDYGFLIPGHGGALDRIDSAILLSLFVNILTRYIPF